MMICATLLYELVHEAIIALGCFAHDIQTHTHTHTQILHYSQVFTHLKLSIFIYSMWRSYIMNILMSLSCYHSFELFTFKLLHMEE